mmetsp:Transcript_9980/g.13907  ORF Transcript_9980/g.13907 Transcript_9980/m.13907 type:complete len:112 (-) Transcript_9980:697-1032(-)
MNQQTHMSVLNYNQRGIITPMVLSHRVQLYSSCARTRGNDLDNPFYGRLHVGSGKEFVFLNNSFFSHLKTGHHEKDELPLQSANPLYPYRTISLIDPLATFFLTFLLSHLR